MKNQCGRLYENLLQAISECRNKQESDQKWIECGFKATIQVLFQVQKLAEENQLHSIDMQVWFFKTMKPKFTSWIDFFTLLYRGILFEPEEPAERSEYWRQELEKCREFFKEYEVFYRYYKNNCNDMDYAWFIRLRDPLPGYSTIKDGIPGFSSLYCSLLSGIIAREKYVQYLEERIAG